MRNVFSKNIALVDNKKSITFFYGIILFFNKLIEPILKELAERFGTDTLAFIIISGYLLFLITFFSRDEKINNIWPNFQWGDRILIGIIMGTFLWFFFILPLAVYGERFYRFIYAIQRIDSIDDSMSKFILIMTYAFSFIIIFIIRKDAVLFSKKGAKNIVIFIKNYFSTYFYISIMISQIEFLLYLISKNAYNLYPSIYNFWFFETIFNFLQTTIIIMGITLILLSLNYFNYDTKIGFIHYIFEFKNNISNYSLKKLFELKYWILLWIIITPILTYPIIFMDNKIALFKPNYKVILKETSGPINLYRNPDTNKSYFTINVWEKIEIKTPFFNRTRYLIIANPSNLSSIFEFPESTWPTIYNELIKLDIIKKGEYLNFIFEPDIKAGKIYEIELHYLNYINPDIYLNEKIGNVINLGNRTYSISYIIKIINNTTDTLHVHQTFSAFKIPSRIKNNKTLEYYENGILKYYADFEYHIIKDWFYPTLRVGPKQNIEFLFKIKGQS